MWVEANSPDASYSVAVFAKQRLSFSSSINSRRLYLNLAQTSSHILFQSEIRHITEDKDAQTFYCDSNEKTTTYKPK